MKVPVEKQSKEVTQALEIGDYALGLLDELPEAAGEFAESASYTLGEILDNIESHNRVTDRQLRAIQNIRNAAENWIEQ